MEVILRVRKKVKIEEVPPGQAFKLIQKQQAFQVIDLTKFDMFKNVAPEQPPVLRDDVVYVSDLSTGIVEVFPKGMEVYAIQVKVEEVN